MGDLDYNEKQNCSLGNEEEMFLNHVVCGEYDLLYLDTYLRETFSRTVN